MEFYVLMLYHWATESSIYGWWDRMKEGEDFGKILSKYESIQSEFSSRNFDV